MTFSLRHVSTAFVITTCLLVVFGATREDYYNLHTYLFANNLSAYSTEIRPVKYDFGVLTVFVSFSLLSLVEMGEKEQTMTTSAQLKMFWLDPFLSWHADDFGGIKVMNVPQKRLWLPDIVVGNGVTKPDPLGFDELPVILNSDGYVDWQPTLLLKTSCSISITYFPFDTQDCSIEFQTAMSSREQIEIFLTPHRAGFDTSYFGEDGQWRLDAARAENVADRNVSKVRYVLTLSRRRTFYLLTIMMPVFFLSLTGSLIFALPPDTGEKTGNGITVLLAFAVYLSIIANLVPNTSLQVSILGVYLTFLLGLTAIGIVCCVFILRLHFRDSSTPVGKRTERCIKFLRRVLRMEPIGQMSVSRNSVVPLNANGEGEDTKGSSYKKGEGQPEVHSPLPAFTDERMTWQEVAATLDWFCFIFFDTCSILTTVCCFLALVMGSS